MARPHQDVRLRHHPHGCEECRRPGKCGTSLRQYRRKYHRTHHPHTGADAYGRRVQQPYPERGWQPYRPFQRHRTCRIGSCRHQELYEDERCAYGGYRSHSATGRQPHRNSQCRIRPHGKDEERLARRHPLQLRFRQYQVYPCLHQRGEADGIRGICACYHYHLPLPARLACDTGTVHRDSGFAHRRFLRDVSSRLLHQCAFHAGGGACRGTGGGRCHCNDREHLRPHRERDATQRSGYRGSQRNILRRNLHHHHTGCRVLPHCIHGRHDGTSVPRIQYCGIRFGGYLFVCRTDLYTDARHQAPGEARTAKLVLSQDRTFLRRNEPGIQQVTGRLPETALDCLALHRGHHPTYRIPLEYYSG